ncbi:hypothetical protein BMF94_1969 [Rhodotorula taiwanensis]|uniref:Uncharacterized protein n=1 Tax=Rhodotorula taiwanensis TaxID=741276 RepID=A0A2S5BE17_9BASI|nr:hypothetical protein BMF94_1969 [Rhodotorula taiwanensis]
MSAFTYLITGASRSLGLGYTRQLLQSGKHVRVVAGARSPSSAEDLQKLRKEVGEDRLYILKLDVEDSAQVANSVKELESSGFLKDGALDCLINNAGVARAHSKNPSQVTPEDVMDNLQTNLFGVIHVTSSFLPLLKKGKGKQIFGVSSTCGSIGGPFGENQSATAYCISKAALNMYSRKLSRELEKDGFTVVVFHPGYVKTDMNSGQGDLTTEEAVRLATENIFLKLGQEENGSFWRYDGERMPW